MSKMDAHLSDRGWVLFTKENCNYCKKAKLLLPDAKIVPCDGVLQVGRQQFLHEMDQLTGQEYRTFPMVFCDGKFVGGYTETAKRIEQEHVFKMVEF